MLSQVLVGEGNSFSKCTLAKYICRKKYVYLKSDIIAAAVKKFGSQEGLDNERNKRATAKRQKLDNQTLKKESRAKEVEEQLVLLGWGKKVSQSS